MEEVIIRGVTHDFWDHHFKEMVVWFGGQPSAPPHGKPKEDAHFIAFYLGAPDSAITHIGIVDRIERNESLAESDTFHLSCVIKLNPPVSWTHQVRNFEYTTLERLGIKQLIHILRT